MIIGLDLDGVVIDWDGGWRKLWNEQGNKPHVRSRSRTWNSPFIDTRLSHADFWRWIDDHACYVTLPPVPDAIETILRLADTAEIVFITQRHPRTYRVTRDWLDLRGLGGFPLTFRYDKSEVPTDLYVDDSPKVLRSLVQKAPWAKIVRQIRPWNRPIAGTTSIRSLKELLP